MRCWVARRLLQGIASGAVSPVEHATLQDHLSECSCCTREARVLEVTRHLLGSLVEGEGPSPDFSQRLRGKIVEIRKGRTAVELDPFTAFARHLIPAAASILLLLGGLAYLARPSEPPEVASLTQFLGSGAMAPAEVGMVTETPNLTQDQLLASVLLLTGKTSMP